MSKTITVSASNYKVIATRIVDGVELKLQGIGKKWTLTAKPEKAK